MDGKRIRYGDRMKMGGLPVPSSGPGGTGAAATPVTHFGPHAGGPGTAGQFGEPIPYWV